MEQLPRLEVSLELRGDEQAVKQVHTMHNGEPTFFTQRIVKVVYCFERAKTIQQKQLSVAGGLRPDSDWIPVHADKEYTLHVILSRINRSKVIGTKHQRCAQVVVHHELCQG